jgi:hypothetical protein
LSGGLLSGAIDDRTRELGALQEFRGGHLGSWLAGMDMPSSFST